MHNTFTLKFLVLSKIGSALTRSKKPMVFPYPLNNLFAQKVIMPVLLPISARIMLQISHIFWIMRYQLSYFQDRMILMSQLQAPTTQPRVLNGRRWPNSPIQKGSSSEIHMDMYWEHTKIMNCWPILLFIKLDIWCLLTSLRVQGLCWKCLLRGARSMLRMAWHIMMMMKEALGSTYFLLFLPCLRYWW